VAVAVEPADEAERQELRSAGILLAASAMGLVRGIVGFVAFMLAFDFKNNDAPLWHLGLVAATAQLGFFVGSVVVPRVRRYLTEERIIIGTLVVMAVGGLVTAVVGGLVGAATLSFIVGAASSMAKQAFDAIVQRDAPDANRGRSFARFETRFQLLWVIGALIPIVVPIPASAGFVMLAAVAVFAVISYIVGASRIRKNELQPPEAADPVTPPPPPPAPPDASARRWAAPGGRATPARAPDWSPPPGFVSSPLGDPPTQVEDEPGDTAYEQVPLPLDVDATVPDRVHDTEVYPEPPWRDSAPRQADQRPPSTDET
jgi:MFS family permease